MRAIVTFADGQTMLLELPGECRYMKAIKIGRPDRIENVTVYFKGWHGKGYAIFEERSDVHAGYRDDGD
jgi:hypothetical protein